jgi:hypothetical protein
VWAVRGVSCVWGWDSWIRGFVGFANPSKFGIRGFANPPQRRFANPTNPSWIRQDSSGFVG